MVIIKLVFILNFRSCGRVKEAMTKQSIVPNGKLKELFEKIRAEECVLFFYSFGQVFFDCFEY